MHGPTGSRGVQRRREERAVGRGLQPQHDVAADAAARVSVGRRLREREARARVEPPEALPEPVPASRDTADAAPLRVANLEDRVEELLRPAVPVGRDGAAVLRLDRGPSTPLAHAPDLLEQHHDSGEDVHGLEPGDDARDAEALRDRLVRPRADDDAHVAGAEEPVERPSRALAASMSSAGGTSLKSGSTEKFSTRPRSASSTVAAIAGDGRLEPDTRRARPRSPGRPSPSRAPRAGCRRSGRRRRGRAPHRGKSPSRGRASCRRTSRQ